MGNNKGYKVMNKSKWTDRPCLCCSKVFKSEGAHHRVCDDCKKTSAWKTGNDEVVRLGQKIAKRPE